MPRLLFGDQGLVLSFEDNPELASEFDVSLYFSSILGLNFDGTASYIFSGTEDFVRTALLIRKIMDFLENLKIELTLDEPVRRMIEAMENSERELENSRTIGTKIQAQKVPSVSVPGFARTLKPYQMVSVRHAAEIPYAANFSVPGSGKTTIAYASYAIMKARSLVRKIIVVGPRSSFMPWEEEYESCFEEKPNSIRIVGVRPDQLVELVKDRELVLLTYQMASSLTSELVRVLRSYDCLLVLDESHHVKKFGGGEWANAVLQIAPYAKRRMILTGTPMPNSLLDIWAQFTFLWPFRNLLGEPLAYSRMQEGDGGLDRVRNVIQPLFCRITKSELKLPPAKYEKVFVPMGRVQRAIYNAVAARTLAELKDSPLDKMKLRIWRRNKIVRLLEAASNPSLLTEYSEEFRVPPMSAEGLPVVDLIENYAQHEIPSKLVQADRLTRKLLKKGEKVIIWNTFIHNINVLAKMLDEFDPLVIHGGVPKDETEDEEENRESRIREFKTDPKPRVLIANPSSCGESVSLHKVCKHALYVDRTFNAGQYIQSLDRIHRIGLSPSDKVAYHILVAQGSVDEKVDSRLEEKYRAMLDVLNDDLPIVDFDTSITEVSDSEFEKDFKAVYEHLRKFNSGDKRD